MRNKLLLSAVLIMGIAVRLSAQDYDFSAIAPSGQTLYYKVVDGKAQVCSPYDGYYWGEYEEPEGSLTIPATVSNGSTTYTVASIGEGAFYNTALTNVVIPNSVDSICGWAFAWCLGLESVTIPNSVTRIGSSAFENCFSLTSIALPNSVVSIGCATFFNCHNLTSITIPSSVTEIEHDAFSGCDLTYITVEASNPKYDSRGNCNAIIETATNTLIVGSNSTIIPSTVTRLAGFAFSGCRSITTINIPSSVDTIGDPYRGGRPFYECSGLVSFTLPASVTYINEGAFAGCSSLNTLVVEESNHVYDSRDGSNAIVETATNTLVCSCPATVIPNTVTTIGYEAFIGHSGQSSIIIPESVTKIQDGAFLDCQDLVSIVIPNSVQSIGSWAFSTCTNLASVSLPNGLQRIEAHTFADCPNLTSIDIPASVTNIKYGAFRGCYGLQTLDIPQSVDSIGDCAFGYCTGLVSITSHSIHPPKAISYNEAEYLTGAFFEVPQDIPIMVPCEAVGAYRAAEGWNYFTNINCDGSGIKDIEDAPIFVRTEGRYIVVSGGQGEASVYDMAGRKVASARCIQGTESHIRVPANGTYIIKVGNALTQRVVVARH